MAKRYVARCPACGAVEDCSPARMLERLRELGMFRRVAEPGPDVLDELFQKSAPRLRCGRCQATGLEVCTAAAETWSDERRCAGCGSAIPWERIELYPSTKLCAACHQAGEQTQGGESEYCPKCGNIMALRTVHGRGVTHYRLVCPLCRR